MRPWMTASSLIDATLVSINREYQPGTLVWIKLNRPDIWKRVIGLEQEINKAVFEGDVGKLKEILTNYQDFFVKFNKLKQFQTEIHEEEEIGIRSLTLEEERQLTLWNY